MADIAVVTTQVAPCFSDPGMAEIYDVIAGATITVGQACYIDSNGRAQVCDAGAGGTAQFRGVALTGGALGQAIALLTHGCVYGFTLTAYNADALIYLSDTAGVFGGAGDGTVNTTCGRVFRLSDADATKVFFVDTYGWTHQWS